SNESNSDFKSEIGQSQGSSVIAILIWESIDQQRTKRKTQKPLLALDTGQSRGKVEYDRHSSPASRGRMACPSSFLPDRAEPMAAADPGRATGRENASLRAGTGDKGRSIDAIAHLRHAHSKSRPRIHASYGRSSLRTKRRERPDAFPRSG